MAEDKGARWNRPSPPRVDPTIPHSARIWNYWLGGKDNYPVDREAGDRYREIYPGIVDTARAVREFMARAVYYLAAEAGIRQFLDVGTGLPAAENTHQVAQRVAPDSRIVYVDNDPLVLAHARALLTGTPGGVTEYVDSDMRDTDTVLAAARRAIDFSEPVALLFMGVLGHIGDDTDAKAVVGGLLEPLSPGSYLAVADSVDVGAGHREAGRHYAASGAIPYRLRSDNQIREFFAGLELVEPGLVSIEQWRPAQDNPVHVDTLGGVARKPVRPRA